MILSSTAENLEVKWSCVPPDSTSQISKHNPVLDVSVLIAMPYDLVSCESSCYTKQFLFLGTSPIWGQSIANTTSDDTILSEFLLTS